MSKVRIQINPNRTAGALGKGITRQKEANEILRNYDNFPQRLKGKKIIITGAATGIGAATALRCAKEGAIVALFDKRFDEVEISANNIMSDGIVQHSKGMAKAFQCDVTNEEEVSNAVKDSIENFFNRIKPETSNMLDGLFSNAGTAGIGWIHETSIEDWEFVLKVNLTGTFLMAKYCLPYMMSMENFASIVTTGSIASLVVGAGGSAASYAASKGGLLQLTKQIAVDYGKYKIRANTLCPGAVSTDLGRHARDDREKLMSTPVTRNTNNALPRPRAWTPMARPSAPAEQASVVAFLLSDDSSFMTGRPVVVDGGLLAT